MKNLAINLWSLVVLLIHKTVYIKTILKVMLLLLLVIIITNCSKSDDNQVEENIRLKTIGINSDEFEFGYNDLNQMVSYQYKSYTGAIDTNNIIYNEDNNVIEDGPYTYQYDALGRVSQVISVFYDNENASLVYNSMGQLTELSFTITFNNYLVTRTFFYDSKNRLIRIEEIDDILPSIKYRLLITYDNNDNIIETKSQKTSNENGLYTDVNIKTFAYDTNVNPISLVSKVLGVTSNTSFFAPFIFENSTFLSSGYVALPLIYVSNNNLLSESSFRSSTGNTTSIEYSYTYNADGYPETMDKTEKLNGTISDTSSYYWIYETY